MDFTAFSPAQVIQQYKKVEIYYVEVDVMVIGYGGIDRSGI